jgi:hypothetical protein
VLLLISHQQRKNEQASHNRHPSPAPAREERAHLNLRSGRAGASQRPACPWPGPAGPRPQLLLAGSRWPGGQTWPCPRPSPRTYRRPGCSQPSSLLARAHAQRRARTTAGPTRAGSPPCRGLPSPVCSCAAGRRMRERGEAASGERERGGRVVVVRGVRAEKREIFSSKPIRRQQATRGPYRYKEENGHCPMFIRCCKIILLPWPWCVRVVATRFHIFRSERTRPGLIQS